MTGNNQTDRQTAAIARAKWLREQWTATADEDRQRSSYRHLSAAELIELAENMPKLTWPELEALDEAWHAMFGEPIVLPDLVPGTARPSTPENTEPALQDDTIIHAPQMLRRTGMSPSSLYRLRTDGRFPAAIQLSERRVGWKVGEIKDWNENRPRQRVFRRRPR